MLRVLAAAFALFVTFGMVTIIFGVFDFLRPQAIFERRWNPNRLDTETLGDAMERAHVVRRRRGSHPITRLVSAVIFLAWWIAARRAPALILGAGVDVFTLGPVWNAVYPWIVTCTLVSIANAVIDLARPQRTHVHFALKVIGGSGGLAVLLFLLSKGNFVILADPAAEMGRLRLALSVINQTIYWSLSCTAIVVGLLTVKDLRSWLDQGNLRPPHDGTRVVA
jgi:hypothetical protein